MAQQQQQILMQRIFLAGPPQWDSWLTAVKTQALAKDIWQFSDPDGTGPSEPITPPKTTLRDFMVKYGIPLPAANAPNPAQPAQPAQPDSAAGPGTPDSTPALTPAPPIVSVTDLNPTQLFEYKTEIRE